MVNSMIEKSFYFKSMKNTYNIKHGGEGQVMTVWLEGQMKYLPIIDKCKVVVGLNVVMGGMNMELRGKDMMVVHKGMVLMHKDMDMDGGDKWALAMMVGQQQ